MRRAIIALGVVALATLAVGTAGAKPHGGGGTPVIIPVEGTFTTLGIEVQFSGTLTVDRFVEVDGQLAVDGVLAADDGPFAPLAVTVVAVAAPSVDATTGDCPVEIGLVNTTVVGDSAIELADPTFELGQPGSGQELCSVLRASGKDPGDQGAIARALNKALGMS
jgi:membrane-associated protease RseP (regulator of RpoE activity)